MKPSIARRTVLTASAAVAVTALLSPLSVQAQALKGGRLRVAILADIVNYDPAQFSSQNFPLIKSLYDSLIEYTPETEEYGISNFVYERRIPFHPERLYDVFELEWPGVIRSKGLFWLATRLQMAGYWSQAGAMCRNQCLGYFWAAVPKEHWPTDPAQLAEIERISKGPNGDCRQEIVLIGSGMDQAALTAMLDAALLTEEELAMEKDEWIARFTDPFPEWNMAIDATGDVHETLRQIQNA